MVASSNTSTIAVASSSSLPSPTVRLTGHKGSVYALQYSPDGAVLCSTSFDKTCLLWSHRNDDEFAIPNPYANFSVLQGHKNAVLDCSWLPDSTRIATASADKTVMLWDSNTGQRLRKWPEHTGIVNAVAATASEDCIVSASDDATCRLWDARQKRPTNVLETDFPVLAVATAGSSDHSIYTAGIDPKVYCWDDRKTQHAVYSMSGHSDTVTSLAVNDAATHVLSNSMDGSLRTWDVRPYCPGKRHVQTFTGHSHGAENGLLKCAWSANGEMVSAGSSDHRLHIWDVQSGQELYDLPGHKGCVNAVAFHPTEATVVASGSSDQQIYVGELST